MFPTPTIPILTAVMASTLARVIDVMATGRSPAPVETVWQRLADTTSWPDWSAFDEVQLEKPGADLPDGLGAIHVFLSGGGKYRVREEIVDWQPPYTFAYVMLEGLPLKNYRADVTLTEMM